MVAPPRRLRRAPIECKRSRRNFGQSRLVLEKQRLFLGILTPHQAQAFACGQSSSADWGVAKW
jgi:hypothetical protein